MSKVISTVPEVRAHIERARELGKKIHFIPTMGALHAGHLALIQQANTDNVLICVSIFINPLQFDDSHDLARYPRSLDADVALASHVGADIIFAPSVADIYPEGQRTRVYPGPLGDELEGAVREAHFSGMLTVVIKLLTIIAPDKVFFGEKDYQQLILVRQMVEDFFLPLDVVGIPTIRDESGLAMSSRNRFLSASQTQIAAELYIALGLGEQMAKQDYTLAASTAREHLQQFPDFSIDYCELRAENLTEQKSDAPARLLIAARLGDVRLIDNIAIPQLN